MVGLSFDVESRAWGRWVPGVEGDMDWWVLWQLIQMMILVLVQEIRDRQEGKLVMSVISSR